MAFINTQGKPSTRDGVVYPYLVQRGFDGIVRPVAVRRDSDLVDTLSLYGEPVTAPDVELARLP